MLKKPFAYNIIVYIIYSYICPYMQVVLHFIQRFDYENKIKSRSDLTQYVRNPLLLSAGYLHPFLGQHT